jgi:hypothetical protein
VLEDESIPADIALFFEKQLACHAVDVDDVRDGRFGELHERERARHARVSTNVERDHLESDVRKVADLDEVAREILQQALADAVYYRDPPVYCPACEFQDALCEDCAAGLERARAYLTLSRTLGTQ